MTYYPKGTPCYYSYTAPFIDESGDVCYYRFDHDEGCWEEDVIYTICQSEEYQESMILRCKLNIFRIYSRRRYGKIN